MRLSCLYISFHLSVIGGCNGERARYVNDSLHTSVLNPDEVTEEVGRVIAGELVTRHLVIKNPTAELIDIHSEGDIRRNCGCSALAPEAPSIEPYSQCRIAVSVDTKGRNGPFSHGGEITWSGASGTKRTVRLTLSGVVVPPLRSEPDAIFFDLEGSQPADDKEIVIAASLPLDWASLTLTSSSGHVLADAPSIEGESARYQIRINGPAEGIGTFSDVVYVTATVANNSPVLQGSAISLSIPIRVTQRHDVTIAPKIVTVSYCEAEGQGVCRLLIQGDLVKKGPVTIRSISCEGFGVKWKMNKPSLAGTAIVELVLEGSQPLRDEDWPKLRIELENDTKISLPTAFVRIPANASKR